MSGINNRNAIFSLSDKEHSDVLAKKLISEGYRIFATKGTLSFLSERSIDVNPIEELAKIPEMLEGRVKTLSSYLLGGVLAKDRESPELTKYNILPIDLVYVEPYDFIGNFLAGRDDLVEYIDIGGITLLRAAAKNFDRVTVIPGKTYVKDVIDNMIDGEVPYELRKKLAGIVFNFTSYYDYAISQWLGSRDESFVLGGRRFTELRYGENPHQKAFSYNFYEPFFDIVREGKEISYNNIMDAWAAWELSLRLGDKSAVIVKHNSPCGASVGDNSMYHAYESDPVSAYGGVYAFNSIIGIEEAKFLKDKYLEVLIARGFSEEALNTLAKKKNLRILKGKEDVYRIPDVKTAGNIILVQEWNRKSGDIFETVTGNLSPDTFKNIEFGWEVIKSIKSNAIIAVENMHLISSEGGQPNRVDSVRMCLEKAKDKGKISDSTVIISDGFFPFKDSIETIYSYGVKIVAAPLGSIRDEEVIEFAKQNGLTFVKINERAFKH